MARAKNVARVTGHRDSATVCRNRKIVRGKLVPGVDAGATSLWSRDLGSLAPDREQPVGARHQGTYQIILLACSFG